MQPYTLALVAKQTFSTVINNIIYKIHIYDVDSHSMCADININGNTVITGVRCLHGVFLLPWPSLEQSNGNFMFVDQLGGTPYWTNFNTTCVLYYCSPNEVTTGKPDPTPSPSSVF
jgi:hypothetical protein